MDIKIRNDQATSSAVFFNFNSYSDILSTIIQDESTDTPLVMGIFGDWGSGKTSLMRTIQHKVKNLFLEEDIKNVLFFAEKLQQQQSPLSQFLFEQFSIELQTKIREFNGRDKTLKKDVLNELNRLIEGPCLFDNERFAEIVLSVETQDLLKQIPVLDNYIYLNRLLLEEAYPEAFLFFSNNDIKDVFSFITELSDVNNPISLHLIEKFENNEFKELFEEIKSVDVKMNNFLSNSIDNMKKINLDDFFTTNKKIHEDFEKNLNEKLNEPIPENDKQVIIAHIKKMIDNIYIKFENDFEENKITKQNFDDYFQKLQNDVELPLINDIKKSLKKWNDLCNIDVVKLIDYEPIQITIEIPGIDIQDSFNDYVNECLDNIEKILDEYVKNSLPDITETLYRYRDNFWEFPMNKFVYENNEKDSLWQKDIQDALYDKITDILLNNIQDLLSTYVQSKLAGIPDSSLLDDHKKIINSVNSLLDSTSALINNSHDQELDDNILTLRDNIHKQRDEKVYELLCRYITMGENSTEDKNWYLFGWDNIPGNDEERFKKYLTLNYGVDWVTTEKFERTDDDRTKRLQSGKRSLFLKRTNDETKVNLEIYGIKTEEFTAKTEQGTLKIYKKCTPNDLINSLQRIVARELNYVLKSGYLYDKEYLFSWEKVPGNDSGRLIEFLMQNFNIEWIKAAIINKNDDGKTIRITNDTNFLSLTLNNEKDNVNLEIDDGRTDKFIVKTENGELNIYNKEIFSQLSSETRKMVEQGNIQNFYRINRFLLEDAYPHEISMNKRNNEGNYTIKTIWFDAWKYDKEEVLWRILLMKILEELKVRPPIENDQASFFRTLTRMCHNFYFRLILNGKLFLYGLHTEMDQKSLFSKVLQVLHTCRVSLLPPLFTENELKDSRILICKLCDTNNPLSAFVKGQFNSELYLFSWEKVPGNDSERLREYLMQNFNIEWIKTAKINKNDDDKTIMIKNDTNFLSLTLEKNNVNLEINDVRTDKFIVKTKNGERNIYSVYSELNQMLQSYDGISEPSPALIKKLLLEFNRLPIDSKTCLYNEQRFSQVNLTEETKKLIDQCPTGMKVIHLNRKLLKEAYGDNNLNKTIEDLQASLYQNIYREELGNIEFKPEKALKGTLKLGISALPIMANINNLIKDMDGKNGLEDLLETLQREKTIKHIKQVQSLEEFEYRFRDIIENYYVKRNKRAVIFIDDLDRCLPEKVIEVLEAIKLFLDAKGCIFILGIDERVVSQAVKLRYKTIPITGENYLEKIIQLTFRLPTKTYENMEDFIEKLDLPDFYEPYRTMIVSGIEPNPRKIKRLTSFIELQRKLAYSIPEIQNELKKSKQINKRFEALLIEWQIISHYYPKFREHVNEDKEIILRLHNRSATQTDIKTIEDYPRLKKMMQNCPIDVSQASLEEIERVISLSNITALEETQEREWKGVISDRKMNSAIMTKSSFQNENLHGKNLRREDLRGMNFIRANLTKTDLREADLREANLSVADLTDADLNKANLTHATLTDAILTRAILTNAILTRAILTDAILTRANLTDAILTDATLTDAILTDATLTGANLTGANLTRANLTGANLTRANLTDAILTGAKLTGTNLERIHLSNTVVNWDDFSGHNLTGANIWNTSRNNILLKGVILKEAKLKYLDLPTAKLEKVILSSAELMYSKLPSAILENAELTEVRIKDSELLSANLKGADLSQAHLTNVVLNKASFEGAILRGAKLESVFLQSARFDSKTDFENADIDIITIKSLKGSNWEVANWSDDTKKQIEIELSRE